jgi:hypothetical protein
MLAMGARLLIDLIEQRPPIEQIGICYSTGLIVRDSTKNPTAPGKGRGAQKAAGQTSPKGE